jgi:hypothetical protein
MGVAIFCWCRKYSMGEKNAIREALIDEKGVCASADFHTVNRCFNLAHEHVHNAVQDAYRKLGEHPQARSLPPAASSDVVH